MISKIFKLGMIALGVLFAISQSALALDVPQHDSKGDYFYVYGPEGDPIHGKEDSTMSIFVDIPNAVTEKFSVEVYDPDASGALDDVYGYAPFANTDTEYVVIGSKPLASKVFSGDAGYDKKWFAFGPFDLNQGQSVGDKHRFEIKVTALKGDDQNLFKLRIKPDQSEVFSDNVTFRLLPNKGDKIYYHPWIMDGVTDVIVHNFDLDEDGGESYLRDPYSNQKYRINDSVSGKWATTNIKLKQGPARRLKYTITTKGQNRGNAGLKITDPAGNIMPVYFQKIDAPALPEPVVAPTNACSRFKFDATESYDINNDKITYDWDFGDGTTSTEPIVTHDFAKGGLYKVVLTVTDNSGLQCNTAVSMQEVRANTPPMAAFAGPALTCTGNSITFNASASKDDTPATLSYHWSFGDGTSAEGQTVTKAFDKGGVYDVVLTVDDNAGTTCSRDSVKQTVRVNTNPTADAGQDQTLYLKDPNASYAVGFNGAGSMDPDKDSLVYLWHFGDGATGDGVKTTHVYENPGDYTAKLVVNDQSGTPCDMSVDTVQVKLNKAPYADAGKEQYTCAGNELTFDAGKSYGEAGETITYNWNFGDGTTATGKVVKHRFSSGGKHQVVLTVNDGRGTPVSESVAVTNVYINSRPTVNITDVGKACAYEKVTFNASNSADADGDKLKYTWDLGDGTVVTGGSSMTHQYKKGGTYKVTLTVDDGKGSPCSQAYDTTTVQVNMPPVANAGPNLVCCQDQVTQFDGSASSDPDGDALSYSWNFGDGNGGTGAKVSHVFKESGLYKVVLSVDDNSGTACNASMSSFTANVNAKPVSVIKVKQV